MKDARRELLIVLTQRPGNLDAQRLLEKVTRNRERQVRRGRSENKKGLGSPIGLPRPSFFFDLPFSRGSQNRAGPPL